MFKLKNLTLTGTLCGAVSLCTALNAQAQHDSPKPVAGRFITTANMDTQVAPGDNFATYANGNWLRTTIIPAKEVSWGSFNVLIDETTKKLITILKDVDKPGQPKGSTKQRVGDLYASGMDSLTIEKRGYTPIKADLQRISQLKTKDDVLNEIAYDRKESISSPLLSCSVGPDDKHPTKNGFWINQAGITLPDRDYYLKDDARTKQIQAAYHTYVTTLFKLTGSTEAEAVKNAETVFGIEKQLATAQMSRLELRDPNKTYNKMSLQDVDKLAPQLHLPAMLVKLNAGKPDSVLLVNPSFVTAAGKLVETVPVADWQVYLAWNVLKRSASLLSAPFVKASFAFNSVLSGQKVQSPRDERMARMVDGSVGELLGQVYVERYFSPAAKQYMVNLINNLKGVLGDRIKRLDWMSAETKTRALKKLSSFTVKIAYPDKWKTYSGLVVNRDDYAGNMRRVAKWQADDNMAKLNKPVDKTEWGMTPPTINAYYNPGNNEIVFPAGILQSPFFNFEADDAINYGGIGAVIGHEMTHGFDDQGRQYDFDGSLHDWWTKTDADKFNAKAEKVAAQFDKYTVLDTVHVNGKLTLGENIADLGGLSIAYEAFKRTKEGQSTTKVDGLTPDQRFFMSWAQVWRSKQRPEYTMQLIKIDSHSPDEARINVPLSNLDAWYNAFDIKPGNKLYIKPEDRARIW